MQANDQQANQPTLSDSTLTELYTEIEGAAVPFSEFAQFKLLQHCKRNSRFYGGPGSELRRLFQITVGRLKQKKQRSLENYLTELRNRNVAPGFHTTQLEQRELLLQQAADFQAQLHQEEQQQPTTSEPVTSAIMNNSNDNDRFPAPTVAFEQLSMERRTPTRASTPDHSVASSTHTPASTSTYHTPHPYASMQPPYTPDRAPSNASMYHPPGYAGHAAPNHQFVGDMPQPVHRAPQNYAASPAPSRGHMLSNAIGSVSNYDLQHLAEANNVSYFQTGSKYRPYVIAVDPTNPEQHGGFFHIIYVPSMKKDGRSNPGYVLRTVVAMNDYANWDMDIPADLPEEYKDRAVVVRGVAMNYYLLNNHRYHQSGTEVTCEDTMYAHNVALLKLQADQHRKFAHWLIIFPVGTIIDNSMSNHPMLLRLISIIRRLNFRPRPTTTTTNGPRNCTVWRSFGTLDLSEANASKLSIKSQLLLLSK